MFEGAEFWSNLPGAVVDVKLVDIDADGDLDLLIAADFETSQVFRNEGDGTFTMTTDRTVITDDSGMGSSIGDYDNDGDLDWFLTAIYQEPTVPGGYTGNRLYRNEGGGVFSDATDEAGVRDGGWGWGSCMEDFDNDGDLDIFHTNGFDSDFAVNAGFEFDLAKGRLPIQPRALEEPGGPAVAFVEEQPLGKGGRVVRAL